MEVTQPIIPGKNELTFDEYELDKMIQKINQAISTREWHYQFFPLTDSGGEYEAILIDIAINKQLMNKVVDTFRSVGWDCSFRDAYDARGPHHCFYVNKKHFNDPSGNIS